MRDNGDLLRYLPQCDNNKDTFPETVLKELANGKCALLDPHARAYPDYVVNMLGSSCWRCSAETGTAEETLLNCSACGQVRPHTRNTRLCVCALSHTSV